MMTNLIGTGGRVLIVNKQGTHAKEVPYNKKKKHVGNIRNITDKHAQCPGWLKIPREGTAISLDIRLLQTIACIGKHITLSTILALLVI